MVDDPQPYVNVLDDLIYKMVWKIPAKVLIIYWPSVLETVRIRHPNGSIANVKWNWQAILLQAVLAMSGQQLVTGLAIIIGGYSKVRCGLSFYQWRTIATLTRFSSIMHLMPLTYLEHYFHQDRYIWSARMFLMTGLIVMLAVGILPTEQSVEAETPAICTFDMKEYNIAYKGSVLTVIISEIMLFGGLAIRLTQMFSSTKRLCTYAFKTVENVWQLALVWSCGQLQRSYSYIQAIFLPVTVFVLAFLIFMQCALDCVCSRFFGVGDTSNPYKDHTWLPTEYINTVVIAVVDIGIHQTLLLSAVGRIGRHPSGRKWLKNLVNWYPFSWSLSLVLLVAEECSGKYRTWRRIVSEEVVLINRHNVEAAQRNRAQQQSGDSDTNDGNFRVQLEQRSSQSLVLNNSESLLVREKAKKSETDSLCVRISDPCKRRFEHEQWYFDTMLFTIAMTIAVANHYFTAGPRPSPSERLAYCIDFSSSIVLICLISIPLCGILNGINPVPEHPHSQQRFSLSVFVVKPAIGREKAYRIARTFYFVCWPASAIIFLDNMFLYAAFGQHASDNSCCCLVCNPFCYPYCCVLHDFVFHLQPSVLDKITVTWWKVMGSTKTWRWCL